MKVLLSAGLLIGVFSTASAGELVERSGNTYHVAVCPRLAPDDVARCMAHVVTDSAGHILTSPVTPDTPPNGYGPADLRSAYNISTPGGPSTVIAIVDAFGYTDAETDLGVYRAQYGLPACTTANGCFNKYNQQGHKAHYPAPVRGWALQTALDLDMASAMCPNCKIILVEAKSFHLKDLAAAEDTAAALGAHVISNSYNTAEEKSGPYAADYDHPGVAITAAAGDAGQGAVFPAAAPTVIAAGGTRLVRSDTPRGWTETAWSGSSSGCSVVYAKPVWQTDRRCKMRMEVDVSADADPATGVAGYAPTAYGPHWVVFGGAGVAAPIIAGIFASNAGPVDAASSLYANPGALNDVTSGSNGPCPRSPAYFCHAEVGYDGPTGLGTPNGNTAF